MAVGGGAWNRRLSTAIVSEALRGTDAHVTTLLDRDRSSAHIALSAADVLTSRGLLGIVTPQIAEPPSAKSSLPAFRLPSDRSQRHVHALEHR